MFDVYINKPFHLTINRIIKSFWFEPQISAFFLNISNIISIFIEMIANYLYLGSNDSHFANITLEMIPFSVSFIPS